VSAVLAVNGGYGNRFLATRARPLRKLRALRRATASELEAGAVASYGMTQSQYRGRLIDHVHLRVSDLGRAKVFYRAALAALGRVPTYESDEAISFDELWIDAADKAGPSHVHLAFQAADHDAVARFHEAGLEAGGRDNGAPGERDYHPGYYAAFLLDPDGHNVEAVFHGPSERSADAVKITPKG
jgi:catechol 2,3-dioxygenase-like lactoylglutathione lyase family enzyme